MGQDTLLTPSAYFGWSNIDENGFNETGGDQVINDSFAPQNVTVPGGWLSRNGVRLALGIDVTTNRNTSLYLRGTADFGYDSRGGGAIADYGVNGGVRAWSLVRKARGIHTGPIV